MSITVESGLPFLSVIVPCRNEESKLTSCLESLISNGYPKEKLEIIIIDGSSIDNTKEIASSFKRRFPDLVHVLDNPNIIVPAGLNIGVAKARGEIITRIDAHSEYPPDYLLKCVQLLQSTGAANAGGMVVTIPNGSSTWAEPIARVTSDRIGVGNSTFRTGGGPGFVDTVPFGTYPRAIFQEIGLFDERLTRNQDNEFNARLVLNGRKIAFDPNIKIKYRNQGTLKGLLRQAFHTGMWNVFTCTLHPYVFRLRHFIPGFFAVYIFCIVFIGLLPEFVRIIIVLPLIVYIIIVTKASFFGKFTVGVKARTAITFFLYHLVYGIGILSGFAMLLTGRWRSMLGKPLVKKVRY